MSAPRALEARVLAAIGGGGEPLWTAGARVAVAVSGGADSVALLELLVRTAGQHGAALSVVTLDHGVRVEAGEAAERVAAAAERRGLPVVFRRLGCGPSASEEALRDARYRVFEGLEVEHVALAHHLDDQVETVLMRLARGSGTGGLGGMAPRRGRYVRPLLGERRERLRAYLQDREVGWWEDPANTELGRLRNDVRHGLLPAWQALRPGAAEGLARAATEAAEQSAALDSWAASLAGPPFLLGELLALPAVVQRRVWRRALPALEERTVLAVQRWVAGAGPKPTLPSGLTLRRDGEYVSVHP